MIEKARIRSWLSAVEMTVVEAEVEPGAKWHLVASKDGFPPLDIVGSGNKGEFLDVIRGIEIEAEHQQMFRSMDEGEFSAFKFGLVRDFLRFPNIQYRLMGTNEKGRFTGFSIVSRLIEPHFHRADFNEALERVNGASVLGVLHVRKALGKKL